MGDVAEKKLKREEYEVQLYGFNTSDISAMLKYSLSRNLKSPCENVHKLLAEKLPEQCSELGTRMKALKLMYEKSLQQRSSQIEENVNSLYSIPDNVLLEEDQVQAVQYTQNEYHNFNQRLEKLQRRARRSKMFNAYLKHELETLDRIEDSVEVVKNRCDIIKKCLHVPQMKNSTKTSIEVYKELEAKMKYLKTKSDVFSSKSNLNIQKLDYDAL